MKIDIVPIKENYHGMGRSLLATDLLTKKSKKDFAKLLDMYDAYIMLLEQPESQKVLEKLMDFEKILRQYEILCEIIAYDTKPIDSAYGYSVAWLGIDIVHDSCESLLENMSDGCVQQALNENGLCRETADIPKLLSLLDTGDVTWEPCYVYRVLKKQKGLL